MYDFDDDEKAVLAMTSSTGKLTVEFMQLIGGIVESFEDRIIELAEAKAGDKWGLNCTGYSVRDYVVVCDLGHYDDTHTFTEYVKYEELLDFENSLAAIKEKVLLEKIEAEKLKVLSALSRKKASEETERAELDRLLKKYGDEK